MAIKACIFEVNIRHCSHGGYCLILSGVLPEQHINARSTTDSNMVDSDIHKNDNSQARIFRDILGWWDFAEPLATFILSSCWSLAESLISPCERFMIE